MPLGKVTRAPDGVLEVKFRDAHDELYWLETYSPPQRDMLLAIYGEANELPLTLSCKQAAKLMTHLAAFVACGRLSMTEPAACPEPSEN